MDVHTRLLRYFAAVADEGNLTQAADRLFVSQPALTKQIKQLEGQMGVELFTRSRAGMALTPAGVAFAERIPALLSQLQDAVQTARGARSEAARVLRLGFFASGANEFTQTIVSEFLRRRPGWQVDLRPAEYSDPTAGLADGQADVALLRLPIPGQDRFSSTVLFEEPRWVALPSTHPLAERAEVSFSELWDEPFVALPEETGSWRDFWLATDHREGRPPRVVAVVKNIDEFLTTIASGLAISLIPAGTGRFYQRPGVAYRPVRDISPSPVGVAWQPGIVTGSAVVEFVQACLDVCGPSETLV